jgi:hypothetical protein
LGDQGHGKQEHPLSFDVAPNGGDSGGVFKIPAERVTQHFIVDLSLHFYHDCPCGNIQCLFQN